MPRYECRIGRIKSDFTTFWMLSKMGFVATKLYNTALWHSKDTWEKTGKIPSGYDLHKPVLASNYREYLHTHTAQKQADQVGRSYRSWFKLRKKDKTANPPGFRKKESISSYTFTEAGFYIEKDGRIRLSIGSKLREDLGYPHKYLWISMERWNTPLPDECRFKEIEVVSHEGYFEIHAKLLLPEPVWKTEGQLMFADLGERNPAVTEDEVGNIDIFKGGQILSHLHYYNKEKARVQSEVMGRTKGKKKSSRALGRMSKRGARQVNHSIHALSDTITTVCIQRDVKKFVIGDLGGIKKEKDGTGKNWKDKPSQNWQQFPIQKFVALLRYKLARHGIQMDEQDERGTSKGRCSVCGCTDRKKIHRVKRGLFLCENCGAKLNADVNGVGNQKARYLQLEKSISSSGRLARPVVWRWNDQVWSRC